MASEERFRAFVTATSDVVYRMSADWREMRQMVGKSFLEDTQTTNNSWLEHYIPAQDRPQVQMAIDEAITTKKPFELEHRVIQADGSVGWTFSRAIPILNPQDEIIEWFGTASDITPYKQAQQARQQSEEQFKLLFDSIDEGFCLIEVLFDKQGQAVDYLILEANPALVRQSGLTHAIGKTMRTLAPDHEQFWYDIYGQVAKTGEPIRFEHEAAALDRFYDVYAFRIGLPGQNRVAVLFNDIKERKRREQNLAFLNEVSNCLEGLTTIRETITELGSKIGVYLGLSHCRFAEIDSRGETVWVKYGWQRVDSPEIIGMHRISDFLTPDFGEKMRAGLPVVVSNVWTDPMANGESFAAVGVGSLITVPLVREGQWLYWMGLYRSEPSDWRPDEIELVVELTNRIWTRLERARAEEALRQSEVRTRLAVEAADLATWEWDLITNEVYWNEQHFQLLGMTPIPNPLPAEVFINHLHPDDAESIKAQLQQAIAEGTLYDAEFRVVRDDQEVRWMSGYGRVTAETDGEPLRASGIMFDINDRRAAEEALRESEARLSAIFESLPVGIGVVNPQGKVIHCNKEMEYFVPTGLMPSRDEARRERWQAQDLEGRPLAPENFPGARALRGERVLPPIEMLYTQDDGSTIWTHVSAVPIRTNAGKVSGQMVIISNINELKKAERALQQADRRKNEFLAMLAHELRNPMATLRNGLQILSITAITNTQAKTVLEMMNRQTDHLVRMVDDLLDVSRISQGKIELRKESVNLVELVSQATEAVRTVVEQKQQQLTVNLPASPVELEGDATRLVQVVINLLTNASRYTPNRGQLDLRLVYADHMAQLRLQDTGIGLSRDQLTSIFELFMQADHSLARSAGGLGIGLTLVKQIVELHGGNVEAQSEGLGKGSTFIVHLPTLNEEQALPTINEEVATAPLRLLIVDDNPDATFMLGMLLKLKGYEVHSRNSGREGVRAAESLRPDVILLDIGMPDLNGYDTCRQIRQQPSGKEVFIVAVSGYGQKEDQQRAQEVGFDQYLTKPVEVEALIQVLSRLA